MTGVAQRRGVSRKHYAIIRCDMGKRRMYTYHERVVSPSMRRSLCRALDPQNLIQLVHGFVSLGEATREACA